MTPGIQTAWLRHGKNAVRYTAAMTLIAGAALFAYQTPAQAQSGATDLDVGTPVSTSPVGRLRSCSSASPTTIRLTNARRDERRR